MVNNLTGFCSAESQVLEIVQLVRKVPGKGFEDKEPDMNNLLQDEEEERSPEKMLL